jgi:hypothetical protein
MKEAANRGGLTYLDFGAHGQFTANDVRPPNNPAAKVLFPLG